MKTETEKTDRHWKEIKWVPNHDLRHVNMRMMEEAELPQHIIDIQAEYGEPVTYAEARARGRWLLKLSKDNLSKHDEAKQILDDAIKRKNNDEKYMEYLRKNVRDLEKQIFIVHEWSSQTATKPAMVRGYKRSVHHSEIYVRTGKTLSPDDHRALYGDITARPREQFLMEIAKRYEAQHGEPCPPGEAEKILASGKGNGKAKIFWYDKPSDTWRGAKWRDVTPTPRWLSVTEKQEAFFRLFDELPPITYNVEDPRKCKMLADGSVFDLVEFVRRKAIERNVETNDGYFTDTKVVELYIASWQCVQRNGKRFGPLWKEKRRGATYNSVTGRHYYHPNMLRSMPRLEEGSEQFLEWVNARVRLYVADDFGADPEQLVEKAITAKDVVRSNDPFSKEIIGRDALDEMRSKRKAEEDSKRKADEPFLPVVEAFKDVSSDLSMTFADMPAFDSETDPASEYGAWTWSAKTTNKILGTTFASFDGMRILREASEAERVKICPAPGMGAIGICTWEIHFAV
jgi:hypothetical protein